jgi:hypothetical protein
MISEVLGGRKRTHELVGSVSSDEDIELALNLPKKLAPEINIEGDLVLPSSSTTQGKKVHKRVVPLHHGASDQEIVCSGGRKHVSPGMNATLIRVLGTDGPPDPDQVTKTRTRTGPPDQFHKC